MTPAEQMEASMRQQAMQLADKRTPAEATVSDVVKEAERVLKFLKAGMTVAS